LPCTSRFFHRVQFIRRDPDFLPSCGFALLQGFPSKNFASPLGARTSHGICRPFDTCVPGESTFPRTSQFPGFVPHPGFLSLFAVYSSPGLAGLFHPAASFGFPFRGFPSKRAAPTFMSTCRPALVPEVALLPSRKQVFRHARCIASSYNACALGEPHGFVPSWSPLRRITGLGSSAPAPLLGFSSPRFARPVRCWLFITTSSSFALLMPHFPRLP